MRNAHVMPFQIMPLSTPPELFLTIPKTCSVVQAVESPWKSEPFSWPTDSVHGIDRYVHQCGKLPVLRPIWWDWDLKAESLFSVTGEKSKLFKTPPIQGWDTGWTRIHEENRSSRVSLCASSSWLPLPSTFFFSHTCLLTFSYLFFVFSLATCHLPLFGEQLMKNYCACITHPIHMHMLFVPVTELYMFLECMV